MIVCFVILLSSIHYMYDYIKNEFTETREVPTFYNYTKKDIFNKDDSNENEKKQNKEKQTKKEKKNEKHKDVTEEKYSEKQTIENDYTPIYQLEKPIEQNVIDTVSSLPILVSTKHDECKKETNDLDDYFKSLH